jgi:hypothetical protein
MFFWKRIVLDEVHELLPDLGEGTSMGNIEANDSSNPSETERYSLRL